jgi:tRNA(Ile)-lysidine synthase
MSNSGTHIPNKLKPLSVKTIFIAISGGVDSVVLLDLLSKNHSNIHLLHVNYHLRGEESNADEQLIRKLATKYTVSISVHNFDMGNTYLKMVEIFKMQHEKSDTISFLRMFVKTMF